MSHVDHWIPTRTNNETLKVRSGALQRCSWAVGTPTEPLNPVLSLGATDVCLPPFTARAVGGFTQGPEEKLMYLRPLLFRLRVALHPVMCRLGITALYVDGVPVLDAIFMLGRRAGRPWAGSATALLKEMATVVPRHRLPRSPAALSRELRFWATFITHAVDVTFATQRDEPRRIICLRPVEARIGSALRSVTGPERLSCNMAT